MEYEYARINLEQTNYEIMPPENFKVLKDWNFEELQSIFNQYCKYKKFPSVMPIFVEDCINSEILGYYDNNELVAWSMIMQYPSQLSACAEQFSWTYHNPKLRLGIESLKSECAYYKNKGFKYLYIHGADEYKKEFQGFEALGPA